VLADAVDGQMNGERTQLIRNSAVGRLDRLVKSPASKDYRVATEKSKPRLPNYQLVYFVEFLRGADLLMLYFNISCE